MSRLRRLVESELSEEQLAVYRGITAGPRASGRQLFALRDESGALNGPFGVMVHAPRLGQPLQELGAAIRYGTQMTDRAREIAILKVAVATEDAFEWYAHERVGRAAGLTDDELDALRTGTFASDDPYEAAVARLSDRVLAGDPFDDEAFEAVSADLDAEEIIEVVVLVGYYRTLAQLMGVFDIGAPTE